MDVGGIAKTPGPTAPNPSPRADALVSAGAVRTEGPAEAAVQQTAGPEAVRFEPSDDAQRRAALDEAVRAVIKRSLTIDPKSREVVFQAVDESTGEVVRQVPEEALLKLRAYAREMRAQEAEEPAVRKTA